MRAVRNALCFAIRQFSGVPSGDGPLVTRHLPNFDGPSPVQRNMRNGAPEGTVWREQDWHTETAEIVMLTCASRFIGGHTR
jgi:hypothetical protein